MSDCIIIYKSKYGTTKRYADWLSQRLNVAAIDVSQFDTETLDRYQTVLFGSSVHIGKVKGIKFLKNNWENLSQKRVIVFASTGSPKPSSKQQEVIEASLPAIICRHIKFFPLPGAYNYRKLDFTDKLLMNLGPRTALRFKAWFKGSKKAKEQLRSFCETQDWTSQEAITPIVSYVNNL